MLSRNVHFGTGVLDLTVGDHDLQLADLFGGHALDPVGHTGVGHLFDFGLLLLRSGLLRLLRRSLRLFVDHRTGRLLFPTAIEPATEGGNALDLVDLDVVNGGVGVHGHDQVQEQTPPIFRGLGATALLHEGLDGRMVHKLRSENLTLDELDQTIVDPEGVVVPDSFGESGGTSGFLGGGVGVGRHSGTPFSSIEPALIIMVALLPHRTFEQPSFERSMGHADRANAGSATLSQCIITAGALLRLDQRRLLTPSG